MRHRRLGRTLGRSPSHRRALLRNLARSLMLTERGRIETTLHKAKEVRPLVEKCVTIAKRSLDAERNAEQYATSAARNSPEWKAWRQGEQWQAWCAARAPVVAARRRALRMLGDKEAVAVLFEQIAPRFEDRPGGYTRIMRLATPRLGDAGVRAVLEFVGEHDRATQESAAPSFDEAPTEEAPKKDKSPAASGSEAASESEAETEAVAAVADAEEGAGEEDAEKPADA